MPDMMPVKYIGTGLHNSNQRRTKTMIKISKAKIDVDTILTYYKSKIVH